MSGGPDKLEEGCQTPPEGTALGSRVMDVDLDALAHNFRQIRSLAPDAQVMPILKADAYGHGLLACARRLEEEGADFFGVAFLEEGLALRRAGISAPILALGGISGREVEKFILHDIDATASSVMKLEALDAAARRLGKKARVHLKIDTGMERIGTHYYSAEPLVAAAARCTHCELVGVFSHLVSSESTDGSLTETQLARLTSCLELFPKHGLSRPLRHLANSGAVLQHPATHLDLLRPGLLLYGIAPAEHLEGRLDLRPVMSLRSEVVFFKVVRKGAGVSYDHLWHAPRQTRIVTVPVGYGDGYPRDLSNCGQVLIRGARYPIVGKVCMDQFMVDLGPDGTAYNGDEVVLLGGQGSEEITLCELNEHVQTDPRDLLLRLALRVPRRYSDRGRIFTEIC